MYSIQTAVSDGTMSELLLTIEYPTRDDIHVYFDDVEDGLGWSWADPLDKKIVFDNPIPSGVVVRVERQTPLDTVPNVYGPDGAGGGYAQFDAESIDENFRHTLLASQENIDATDIAVSTAQDAIDTARQAVSTASTALDTAIIAEGLVGTAVSTANSALSAAVHAVSTADAAYSVATGAAQDAASAVSTAESTVSTANNALSVAQNALGVAQSADSTANRAAADIAVAISAANDALSEAQQALSAALGVVGVADHALSVAAVAEDIAMDAISVANDSLGVAQGIASAANNAMAQANDAVLTANTALNTANSIASIANAALSTATDAESAAGSAVSLAGTALDTANSAMSVISGLGTASVQDVGTGSADVPQNKDLGSAAYTNITSSISDTTSGRVPTVGWMGLEGTQTGIKLSAEDDLNDCVYTGFYSQNQNSDASLGNNYPEARAGCLFVYPTAGNSGIGQTYYQYTGNMWLRTRNQGDWSSWYKVFTEYTPPSASDITSGTFSTSRIPNLSADKITSGTFNSSRIPNLSASKITSGTFNSSRIPNLSASKITSGTIAGARLPTTYGTVGSYVLAGIRPSSALTVNTGATVAGSRLGAFGIRVVSDSDIGLVANTVGAAMSGTWRNVSGTVVRSNSTSSTYPTGMGLFVRIS